MAPASSSDGRRPAGHPEQRALLATGNDDYEGPVSSSHRGRIVMGLGAVLFFVSVLMATALWRQHGADLWLQAAGLSEAYITDTGGIRNGRGYCKATTAPTACTLEHTEKNRKDIKVSLFGNSYSGFYCWTDYGLQNVFESVHATKKSEDGLYKHELHPHVSMHTLFDSGLYHHVSIFRYILEAEDPDYVVLQDGSLIAFGQRGGHTSGGGKFKATKQFRNTIRSMSETFGATLWDWAGNHQRKHGKKCVVMLVAAWARPEEAFLRAQAKEPPELHDMWEGGSWAEKNYEVHRGGVTASLNSKSYTHVHHEGEMLEATLEGLGMYREMIFKGAAAQAGDQDSADFRARCPFEVALAPLGVAFHDVRVRTEDIFRARAVPDVWWKESNRSTYVHLPKKAKHQPPTQSQRKNWFGAGEKDFLFADQKEHMPWFGHPTPAGTFLYGSLLKRAILSIIKGGDGKTWGDVQLRYDSGVASKINNVLLEEVNHFDFKTINEEWKHRGAEMCSKRRGLCPGGGVDQRPVQHHTKATTPAPSKTTFAPWPEPEVEPETGTPAPLNVWDTTKTKGSAAKEMASGATADLEEVADPSHSEEADAGASILEGVDTREFDCSEEYADCRSSPVCCDTSMTCYEKNDKWASCMKKCAPGIHSEEVVQWRTPWSCRRLVDGGIGK